MALGQVDNPLMGDFMWDGFWRISHEISAHPG